MARHERRAHAVELALRHAPGKHQRLGAAADRAEQRPHPHFVRGRRRERFLADIGLSGRAIPERLGRLVGPPDRHFTLSSDWTLRRFAVLYHRVCTVRPGIRSRNRVLERSPPQAMQADTAGNDMFVRRLLFAVLFAVTMAGSLALAALALAPGGLGLIDVTLLALFAVTLPWMVAGFWNAVIGLLIMRFSADPTAAVMPMAAAHPRR